MLYSCMNNTKWNEIRMAMVSIESSPYGKSLFSMAMNLQLMASGFTISVKVAIWISSILIL